MKKLLWILLSTFLGAFSVQSVQAQILNYDVPDTAGVSPGVKYTRFYIKNGIPYGRTWNGGTLNLAPVRSVNGKVGAAIITAPDITSGYFLSGRYGPNTIPIGAIALSGTADNTKFLRGDGSWAVPPGSGGGGSVAWGNISGTLADQSDLNTALSGKQATISTGTTNQFYSWDKTFRAITPTMIGLGNVQNVDQTNASNLSSGSIPALRFGSLTIPLTAINATGTASSSTYLRGDGTWATVSGGGGGGTWGSITGTLSSQTDLNTALGGKEPTISSGTTSQYWRGDKSWQTLNSASVGLGNVPNTDATNASNLSSGSIPTLRFGNLTIPLVAINATGTASSSTYLRGDGTWSTISSGVAWGAITGTLSNQTDLQSAFNLKAPLLSPTFSGTPTAPTPATSDNSTKVATTEWVKLQGYGVAGGGSATWGNITGTLSSQTDLNTALNGKEPSITSGTTSQYWRGDKSWQTLNSSAVGLGNVDNTSDANKPVSTATQTALNGKEATISSGTTAQYWRGDKSWQTLNSSAVGLGNVTNSLQVINGGGVVSHTAGLFASRPTVGTAGRFYYATDQNTVYYDNGTSWVIEQPALSGDVTSSAGSTNNVIANNVVSNAKLSQMAANTIKGNNTGSTANAADLTVSQAKTMLSLNNVDNTSDASKPVSTATQTALNGKENSITAGTTSQYWRGDKSWQTLDKTAVGLSNVPNTDATNASNLSTGSIPSGRYGAGTIPVSGINATGTPSSSNFLRGDGSWSAVPSAGWDITNYTVSALRAASPTSAYVYITDAGKQGVFAYNASNTSGTDNTGTVLVSANGRRYERIIVDKTISVKFFDVTGDGTTNDNSGMVAAYAVADGSTINTIFHPAGTYKVNVDALTIQSGVRVVGDNGAKLLASTTPTSQANLLTTTGSNVSVFNLEFTASTYYVRGLKASSGTNIKVQNCRATTATLAEFNNCNVVEVTGCYAKTTQNFGGIGTQSSAWACIHMYFTNYFTVDRNYIDGYGHNIQFWGGDANNYLGQTNVPVPISVAKGIKSGKISNNTSINSGGGCIWGGMAEDILVSNNYCANCADVGIDFEACKNSKAEFNTIKDCGNGNFGMFYYNGQIEWDNNISIVTSSSYHHVIMADIATSVDVGSQIVKFTNNTFEAVGHISIIGDAAQIFGSFKYMHVNENVFKNTTWQLTTAGHYKEFKRNRMTFDISANNAALAQGGFTAVNNQPGRCVIEGNEILFRNGGTTAIGIQLFAGDASAINYATIEKNVVIGATIDLNTKFSINSATYIPVIQVNENVFNTNNWVREEPSSGSSANVILRKNKRLDGTPTLLTDTPTSGFWTVGQEAVFYNVTSSGKTGMVNVLAGSPGTWDDLQWTLPANGNSNLLRGGTVTASSSLGGTQWQASNLIDGGRTSGASVYGWSSSAQGSEFVSLTLTMDMGSFKTFNSLYLFPTNDAGYEGAGFPRDFAISTSTDNTTYLSAYTTTGQLQPTNGQPLKVNFPVRYARYVKLVITRIYASEASTYKAQLRALELY